MPLLKYGRQWSKQALTWGTQHLGVSEKLEEWDTSASGALFCARKGCDRTIAAASGQPLPIFFEGKDICSRACFEGMIDPPVQEAFRSERMSALAYNHRMPLGLLMLSRGWITHQQLVSALGQQKEAGYGRLGECLVAAGACPEETIAQAVAAQWGIPVLFAREPSAEVAGLLPPILMEACGAIPVRVAAHRILYLAVEQQVHPSLNLAVERMTGFRVQPACLPPSSYRSLQQALRDTTRSAERLFQSASASSARRAILSLVDERPTRNVQVVSVGNYLWLRLLRRGKSASTEATEDVIFLCSSVKTEKLRELESNVPAFGHPLAPGECD